MNVGDLRTSKFLRKEDVGIGVLVTISAITQENVAMQGAEPELRAVLHFQELDKPMVLNSTNGQIIAKITGKDEDIEHAWLGAKVVLYNDPYIQYGGKVVGGIRARAPKPGSVPVQAPAPAVAPVPQGQDGLPF